MTFQSFLKNAPKRMHKLTNTADIKIIFPINPIAKQITNNIARRIIQGSTVIKVKIKPRMETINIINIIKIFEIISFILIFFIITHLL